MSTKKQKKDLKSQAPKVALLLGTFPEAGYGFIKTVQFIDGEPIDATVKWASRDPNHEKERHNPPAGETHILTVEKGSLLITYTSPSGKQRMTLGSQWKHQTIIFQDHAPESEDYLTRSGHTSKAGPRGARVCVQIVKGENPKLPVKDLAPS